MKERSVKKLGFPDSWLVYCRVNILITRILHYSLKSRLKQRTKARAHSEHLLSYPKMICKVTRPHVVLPYLAHRSVIGRTNPSTRNEVCIKVISVPCFQETFIERG